MHPEHALYQSELHTDVGWTTGLEPAFSCVHSAWARLFALVHGPHVWNRTSIGRLSSDCTKPLCYMGMSYFGRRGGSRTRMLLVPNQAAYQQAFTPMLS